MASAGRAPHREGRGSGQPGSVERRSGAAPDLDPLDPPAPERLRKGRRGGPGRQDVVHDRHLSKLDRPAANAERPRDVLLALGRASRPRLGRGVAPVDAEPSPSREAQRPTDDGGQLLRVVESAVEEPSPGDGHPDHRAGYRKAGAERGLPREEPPERGRRGELPVILHAMDEAAEWRCEAPRRDHPIEGRGLLETCGARRGGGVRAGGRRRGCGVHGERGRAARAGRAMRQRVQGAFAVGARIVGDPDLAAEAARPREEPVRHVSSQAPDSRSLPHRHFARPQGRVGTQRPPCPLPNLGPSGPDPAPAAAIRRPPRRPGRRHSSTSANRC